MSKLHEVMRKIRVKNDAERAGRLSWTLRSKGVQYHDQIKIYGKANSLDERTAAEEWEDLMQEAELS
jgi:hypothetical protein